jgi:hypothetical protein
MNVKGCGKKTLGLIVTLILLFFLVLTTSFANAQSSDDDSDNPTIFSLAEGGDCTAALSETQISQIKTITDNKKLSRKAMINQMSIIYSSITCEAGLKCLPETNSKDSKWVCGVEKTKTKKAAPSLSTNINAAKKTSTTKKTSPTPTAVPTFKTATQGLDGGQSCYSSLSDDNKKKVDETYDNKAYSNKKKAAIAGDIFATVSCNDGKACGKDGLCPKGDAGQQALPEGDNVGKENNENNGESSNNNENNNNQDGNANNNELPELCPGTSQCQPCPPGYKESGATNQKCGTSTHAVGGTTNRFCVTCVQLAEGENPVDLPDPDTTVRVSETTCEGGGGDCKAQCNPDKEVDRGSCTNYGISSGEVCCFPKPADQIPAEDPGYDGVLVTKYEGDICPGISVCQPCPTDYEEAQATTEVCGQFLGSTGSSNRYCVTCRRPQGDPIEWPPIESTDRITESSCENNGGQCKLSCDDDNEVQRGRCTNGGISSSGEVCCVEKYISTEGGSGDEGEAPELDGSDGNNPITTPDELFTDVTCKAAFGVNSGCVDQCTPPDQDRGMCLDGAGRCCVRAFSEGGDGDEGEAPELDGSDGNNPITTPDELPTAGQSCGIPIGIILPMCALPKQCADGQQCGSDCKCPGPRQTGGEGDKDSNPQLPGGEDGAGAAPTPSSEGSCHGYAAKTAGLDEKTATASSPGYAAQCTITCTTGDQKDGHCQVVGDYCECVADTETNDEGREDEGEAPPSGGDDEESSAPTGTEGQSCLSSTDPAYKAAESALSNYGQSSQEYADASAVYLDACRINGRCDPGQTCSSACVCEKDEEVGEDGTEPPEYKSDGTIFDSRDNQCWNRHGAGYMCEPCPEAEEETDRTTTVCDTSGGILGIGENSKYCVKCAAREGGSEDDVGPGTPGGEEEGAAPTPGETTCKPRADLGTSDIEATRAVINQKQSAGPPTGNDEDTIADICTTMAECPDGSSCRADCSCPPSAGDDTAEDGGEEVESGGSELTSPCPDSCGTCPSSRPQKIGEGEVCRVDSFLGFDALNADEKCFICITGEEAGGEEIGGSEEENYGLEGGSGGGKPCGPLEEQLDFGQDGKVVGVTSSCANPTNCAADEVCQLTPASQASESQPAGCFCVSGAGSINDDLKEELNREHNQEESTIIDPIIDFFQKLFDLSPEQISCQAPPTCDNLRMISQGGETECPVYSCEPLMEQQLFASTCPIIPTLQGPEQSYCMTPNLDGSAPIDQGEGGMTGTRYTQAPGSGACFTMTGSSGFCYY